MHRISLFWICLALLVSWQCSSSDKRETADEQAAADSLSYTYQSISRQSATCQDEGSPVCAEVGLRYPALADSGSEAASQIQQEIMREITRAFMEEEQFSTAEAVAEGFLSTYRIILEQNEGYAEPWKLERNARVYVNNDTLFGIHYTEYLYTGGPRPNRVLQYMNFNPHTGERLKVGQLAGQSKLSRWRKQAEDIFRDQQQLAPDTDLEEAGYWFSDNEFYLPDNFRLTPDSVIFYFNPYEVAPHAKGLVRIALER